VKEGDIFYSRILGSRIKVVSKIPVMECNKCVQCSLYYWCIKLGLRDILFTDDIRINKEYCNDNNQLVFDLLDVVRGDVFGEIFDIISSELDVDEKISLINVYISAWALERLYGNNI